jgi:hypothetical protein
MMSAQGQHAPHGLSVVVRPMTEAEKETAKAIPRPLRNNAVGISVVAMVMAVMVNFVEETFAVIMPLFFCFVGLGLAVQARRSSGAVAQALAKGTVTEVRGAPKWKGSAGGWDFGPFSVPKDSQVKNSLADGVPARVSVIPETKRLVSVNGATLKKPIELRAPPGFEAALVAPTTAHFPQKGPKAAGQELPPPPDDWTQGRCPSCGQSTSQDFEFCSKCGFRLKQ